MYPWPPIFFFVVVYTPTWDSSKSWYALGCLPFLSILCGVVAGVGVPSGHPSFFVGVVVYTPMWDSSKSWCALGCPSFLFNLSGVVAGVGVVGVPLATHLLFLLLLLFFNTPAWLSILSFKP